MTTIALILQRLGPEIREPGLELFERLLEAGLPDAESILNEIDRRIPIPSRGILPRLRRRRWRGT
jgi:hypothetical protein